MNERLSGIKPRLRFGEERIHAGAVPTELTLADFWQWQGSNLMDNSLRGILAEFLVTKALECKPAPRVEWETFDCLTDDGIKVEVKSSAYIQSWAQKDFSKISFDIAPKKSWM